MSLAAPKAATLAWWVWVLGQGATVVFYAGGVRPAAGYPIPVEATADLALAAVQCVLAATLGPLLFGTAGRVARALAAALPLTVLAVRLAGTDGGTGARTALISVVWVLALGLPSGRIARAVASGLTLGGPILWYVAVEYGPRPAALGEWPTLLCPILGICLTRLHGGFAGPASFALATLVLLLITSRVEHRYQLRPRF